MRRLAWRGNRAAAGILVATLLLGTPATAEGYVGPGLGAGAVVAVVGIIVGLLMLVFGAVWYPIKRASRAIRRMLSKR